ncbi:MAG: hypothetical protein V3V00_14960 [Saprospiraceae bacterium]
MLSKYPTSCVTRKNCHHFWSNMPPNHNIRCSPKGVALGYSFKGAALDYQLKGLQSLYDDYNIEYLPDIPSLDGKVGSKGNVPPNQNLIKRCFPNTLYILDAPKCLN